MYLGEKIVFLLQIFTNFVLLRNFTQYCYGTVRHFS